MALSVAEREHWINRISHRIDNRIGELQAVDPNLKDRIAREAWSRALQSLRLVEVQAELDRIGRERAALEMQEMQVRRRMLAQFRGVLPDDIDDTNHGYYSIAEVTAAISSRQKAHEVELLAECDTGREILRLREEKESLPDAIWLTTGPSQLRSLLTKVNELLSAKPTQLERDSMAIPATGANCD